MQKIISIYNPKLLSKDYWKIIKNIYKRFENFQKIF